MVFSINFWIVFMNKLPGNRQYNLEYKGHINRCVEQIMYNLSHDTTHTTMLSKIFEKCFYKLLYYIYKL